VQPQGPYCVGGYCYGGVVAYEMARQLSQQGEAVRLVAIVDGYTPRGSRQARPRWHPRYVAAFLVNLPPWLRDYLPEGPGPMIARLRRPTGWDLGLPRSLPEPGGDEASGGTDHQASVTEGLLKAIQAYRPQGYGGRVTLFRVRTLSFWRPDEADMGWGAVAKGGVEIHMVPGSHQTVLAKPHVEAVAAALRSSLNRVT
jgi:thioesterase domain-containing protein